MICFDVSFDGAVYRLVEISLSVGKSFGGIIHNGRQAMIYATVSNEHWPHSSVGNFIFPIVDGNQN
jgi:hypothetical protein